MALLGTPSPAPLNAATRTQNRAPGVVGRVSRRWVPPSTVLLVGRCQPSPTDQTWGHREDGNPQVSPLDRPSLVDPNRINSLGWTP